MAGREQFSDKFSSDATITADAIDGHILSTDGSQEHGDLVNNTASGEFACAFGDNVD